ncbi:hypothetical protein T492DRAFT_909169 [Pavlovales sp. CCMP2436]|nr:hypothetical protein T492DRAFT_909169 [Pavlovales sp. CCMP2436]
MGCASVGAAADLRATGTASSSISSLKWPATEPAAEPAATAAANPAAAFTATAEPAAAHAAAACASRTATFSIFSAVAAAGTAEPTEPAAACSATAEPAAARSATADPPPPPATLPNEFFGLVLMLAQDVADIEPLRGALCQAVAEGLGIPTRWCTVLTVTPGTVTPGSTRVLFQIRYLESKVREMAQSLSMASTQAWISSAGGSLGSLTVIEDPVLVDLSPPTSGDDDDDNDDDDDDDSTDDLPNSDERVVDDGLSRAGAIAVGVVAAFLFAACIACVALDRHRRRQRFCQPPPTSGIAVPVESRLGLLRSDAV